MASQNSPTSALEPIPATKKPYKPRKTLKPPALQAKVLTKRHMGDSKRQIAKDLGIAFNTVTSIVELNNFDSTLQSEQAESLNLIPLARNAVLERLKKNDGNIGLRVLENTIWPLNAKTSKQQDPHLTLAIQNLMGNVTVGQPGASAPANQPQTTTNSVLPESSDTSTKPTIDK
jgi:hypothetical protein